MKVILCGACGRMGREVTNLAPERGVEIVCGVDICPKPAPYPVYTSFEGVTEHADVMIDFSSAEGLATRLAFAERRRLPLVLATTGFTPKDEEHIIRAATCIPILKTGNFSIGINLLQLLVKKAASVLGTNFDVEIIERHHSLKKDAPSGTALMLAESVKTARTDDMQAVYSRHGMDCKREKGEIGIHAVRGGTVVGEHEVGFYGEDEIVLLSHSARSRKVFASGALTAAAWLPLQPAGSYDMRDLLAGIL